VAGWLRCSVAPVCQVSSFASLSCERKPGFFHPEIQKNKVLFLQMRHEVDCSKRGSALSAESTKPMDSPNNPNAKAQEVLIEFIVCLTNASWSYQNYDNNSGSSVNFLSESASDCGSDNGVGHHCHFKECLMIHLCCQVN